MEIHVTRSVLIFMSAGSVRGGGHQSNRYNVIMIGDSSVGKTSFMKRAQSGKFSLDLPSSIGKILFLFSKKLLDYIHYVNIHNNGTQMDVVGVDSCTWTVVVDEKHVVLQLWDTAGQER